MDIGEFYAADPRRRASDEVALGKNWRLSGEKGTWSVFWVRDTGEVVAMRTGWFAFGLGGGEVLGAVEALAQSPRESQQQVEVLLVETDEAALHRTLDGWQDQERLPDGYAWLLNVSTDRLLAAVPDRMASDIVRVEWWDNGKPPDEQPSQFDQLLGNIPKNVLAGLLGGAAYPGGSIVLISRSTGEVVWRQDWNESNRWTGERLEEIQLDLSDMSWSAFAAKYELPN